MLQHSYIENMIQVKFVDILKSLDPSFSQEANSRSSIQKAACVLRNPEFATAFRRTSCLSVPVSGWIESKLSLFLRALLILALSLLLDLLAGRICIVHFSLSFYESLSSIQNTEIGFILIVVCFHHKWY